MKYEIYTTDTGHLKWRLIANNNHIICKSARSFALYSEASLALSRFLKSLGGLQKKDLEEV